MLGFQSSRQWIPHECPSVPVPEHSSINYRWCSLWQRTLRALPVFQVNSASNMFNDSRILHIHNILCNAVLASFWPLARQHASQTKKKPRRVSWKINFSFEPGICNPYTFPMLLLSLDHKAFQKLPGMSVLRKYNELLNPGIG